MIGASSYHSGGVNVAFIDGSVKFIKDSINAGTWGSLATHGGGEVIDASALTDANRDCAVRRCASSAIVRSTIS